MSTQSNLSLADLTMGRDSSYLSEYTLEIATNLQRLCDTINAFLNELGIKNKPKVSSGWRPAAINNSTKNAAKRSSHTVGLAVDILDDKDQNLAKMILIRLDLLKKHGLYLEDPQHTVGKYTNWVHLQLVAPKSGKQVFKP